MYAGPHLGGRGHPEPAKLPGLVRVVAEQGEPRHPQRPKHLRGDQIAALVLSVAERRTSGTAALSLEWTGAARSPSPNARFSRPSTRPSKLNTRARVVNPSASSRGTDTWVRIVAQGNGGGIDSLRQSVTKRGESA
jgi:hypothetical protein